jgi:hypothetical protein
MVQLLLKTLRGSFVFLINIGSPRCRWEDIVKMDLQNVGWWDMDWIDLAQYRDRLRALVYAVMILRVP